MGVILNRITGENVTVLLPRYHAPYYLSPMDARGRITPPTPPFPATLQGAQSLTSTTTQYYHYASTIISWGHYGFYGHCGVFYGKKSGKKSRKKSAKKSGKRLRKKSEKKLKDEKKVE